MTVTLFGQQIVSNQTGQIKRSLSITKSSKDQRAEFLGIDYEKIPRNLRIKLASIYLNPYCFHREEGVVVFGFLLVLDYCTY